MRKLIRIGRAVVDTVRDEEITFLAAAIAYYAFVSLLPALLLALVVASVVGGDRLVTQVLGAGAAYLSPTGQDVLGESLRGARGRAGATAVGVLLLGWTTLRVFRGLDIAFSRVYRTSSGTFLGQLRNAVIVVLSVGIGIGSMIGVGAVLAVLNVPIGRRLVGLVALLLGLVIVFLPLYYVFPGRRIGVRGALPGAVVAAVGWVILQAGFQVYASLAEGFAVYGVIGGVLLIVTWFYVAAIVILVGAAVNVVVEPGGGVGNRQGQGNGGSEFRPSPMDPDEDGSGDDTASADIEELRREFAAFKADVDERTIHRSEIKAELEDYVRDRVRRGHARAWGPYLVLLYGTVMTIGAFYLLSGVWAVLAMVLVWLSTLGLYAVMLVVGAGLQVLGVPRRAIDAVRNRRR